jgi:hypothetical protein
MTRFYISPLKFPFVIVFVIYKICCSCLHTPNTYIKLHKKDIEPPKAVQLLPVRLVLNTAQLQSRLFQLPGELRNRVFEEVVGAGHVHITVTKKVRCVRCGEITHPTGDAAGRTELVYSFSECCDALSGDNSRYSNVGMDIIGLMTRRVMNKQVSRYR